jgi:hypothetical protein
MNKYIWAIASCAAVLTACQATPSEPFGSSVREMVRAQTASPAAAEQLPPVVVGADPEVVNAAVESMRRETEPRKDQRRDVTISVGRSSAQWE